VETFWISEEGKMPWSEKIPLSAPIEIVCAWEGCNNIVFIGDTLPAGWKHIVVAPGSLLEKQNLLSADVDGILCPDHFAKLRSLLKLGQQH